MKELDGDSLFSIFEKGDEDIHRDSHYKIQLDSSFILLGTVIRGVDNYFLIDQLYTNRYQERYLSVKENLKLKYFIRLVKVLQRITEFDSKTASMLVDEFGETTIIYVFQYLLSYFEENEYYEICVVLKKYFDIFTEKSLIY